MVGNGTGGNGMERVIPRDSLVGMVGAPIVWSAHFLLVYVFAALACAFRFSDREFLGVSVVVSAMLIATLAMLAAVGWMALLSWRRFRQADRDGGGGERGRNPVAGRHRFMALTTFLLCVLSATAIVYETIPLLIISPPCA